MWPHLKTFNTPTKKIVIATLESSCVNKIVIFKFHLAYRSNFIFSCIVLVVILGISRIVCRKMMVIYSVFPF